MTDGTTGPYGATEPMYPSAVPAATGYGVGYGYGPPPPPPTQVPPSSSHSARWIVLIAVVAALAIAAVVVVVVLRVNHKVVDAKGTSGRSLILPSSVDGRPRITSIDTEAAKERIGTALTKYGGNPQNAVAHAVVAYYGRLPRPSIQFIGIAVRDVPELRHDVEHRGVERTVAALVSSLPGSGSSSRAFPPGPKRGFMRCARARISSQPLTTCVWADESIVAITLFPDAPSLNSAAGMARDLRNAGEQ